jgi:uncharacterized protein (DUF1501 family)
MALTRRQFLTRTGAAAAGSFLAPSFFRNPLLQQALAAHTNDRFLVVVFLDGGNDGINTVVPYDDVGPAALRTAYQAARLTGVGGLQLSQASLNATLLNQVDPTTGTPLALHPGLIGLKNLESNCAVIQGVGYPDYSLSHDESRTAWQTANPLGLSSVQHGWLGRYLATGFGPTDIPAVNIGDTISGDFRQRTTNVLTLYRLQYFDFPFDEYNSDDLTPKRTGHLALAGNAAGSAQAALQYLGNTGSSTLLATENYQALHALYNARSGDWYRRYSSSDVGALNTGFARDLREVAKVIYGVAQHAPGVAAHYFEVRNGGYDTHSDQGGDETGSEHLRLHHEVGDALELFYADLADMGVVNNTCILVYSEFSRRIQQNDNGSDHGSQGPVFVIGGGVTGGVYGEHPNINGVDSNAPQALDDNGNTPYSQAPTNLADLTLPFRATDIRDVYGTVLKHFVGLTDAEVLALLPLDVVPPAEADQYWTLPNFDLGFL